MEIRKVIYTKQGKDQKRPRSVVVIEKSKEKRSLNQVMTKIIETQNNFKNLICFC